MLTLLRRKPELSQLGPLSMTSPYGRVIPTRFWSLSSRRLTLTRSDVFELLPFPFTVSSSQEANGG